MYFKNAEQNGSYFSGSQFCGAYGLRLLSQLQHAVNGEPEAIGWLTGGQRFRLEPLGSVNILGSVSIKRNFSTFIWGLVKGKLKFQPKILRFVRLYVFCISNSLIYSLFHMIAFEISYEITAIPTGT